MGYDYSLHVSIYPQSKPHGPSYDNYCANYKKSQKSTQNQNVTIPATSKNVRIQHILRFCDAMECNDYINEDLNVKVDSSQLKVVNINQTVASCDYDGFKGCDVNPRNLTLWINETGQLDMAIGEICDLY